MTRPLGHRAKLVGRPVLMVTSFGRLDEWLTISRKTGRTAGQTELFAEIVGVESLPEFWPSKAEERSPGEHRRQLNLGASCATELGEGPGGRAGHRTY